MVQALGTNPLISLTVQVYKFWSLMEPTSRRRLLIFPVCIMNLFQFLYLYKMWGNLELIIINAFLTILYFNAMLRAIMLMLHREKFESFIRRMDQAYNDIEKLEDPATKSVMSQYTLRARLLTKFNFTLGVVVSGFFSVYPFFTSRSLPYGLWIPGIDIQSSPAYELVYILEVILTAPGCVGYIPFTCFFVSSTLFGIVRIKTLQQQLRTVKDTSKDNVEIDKKLNGIIEYQNSIIQYIEDLNSLVSFICLVELLSFGLMLVALLFLLSIIEVGTVQFSLVFSYIMTILFQVFIWYWHSNEIREESMAISRAVYECDFLDFTIPMKKKLILITVRAQKPLEIKVGNWTAMSLEKFQALLNTAYSYFNIIRTFNK